MRVGLFFIYVWVSFCQSNPVAEFNSVVQLYFGGLLCATYFLVCHRKTDTLTLCSQCSHSAYMPLSVSIHEMNE